MNVTIVRFALTKGFGQYYIADVDAALGNRTEYFSVVSHNPKQCIRELESLISLKFDTLFNFEKPMLFSEN